MPGTPDSPIGSKLTGFLLLPSFLCLDAPLVALGWGWALAGDVHGPGPVTPRLLGLFFGVWVVYLLDRIGDRPTEPFDGDTPLRHRFAARHAKGLAILAGAVAGVGACLVVPRLGGADYLLGAAFGGVTLLYYSVFRFRGRNRGGVARRFPAKEFVIALCLVGGVCAGAEVFTGLDAIASKGANEAGCVVLFGMGLGVLFLANCLLISRAESEYDARHDPASFAAGRRRGLRKICLCLIGLSVVVGGVLLVNGSLGVSSLALVAAALLEGAVVLLVARRSPFTQVLADGVLLVPWLCAWGVLLF